MTPNHTRVAESWLTASRTLTAKAQYLKAIDFTIGLVRRLERMGKPLPGMPTPELLARLVDLREAAQQGVNLHHLKANLRSLNVYGERILARIAQEEARIIPSDEAFSAFVKPFPKTIDRAVEVQSRHLEQIISRELNVPVASITPKLMSDQSFYSQAYAAVLPSIAGKYQSIVGQMSSLGRLEHRIKGADSCWGKQFREDMPFHRFKDMVGTRVVASTIPQMANVAKGVQDTFNILDKKNYYLKGGGYNAINYNMADGWLVFEFQVKTEVNAAEAALSHDLVYAKEKAVMKLTEDEKRLVGMVIDVSTQLSMAEWNQAFGVPVRMARQRPMTSFSK